MLPKNTPALSTEVIPLFLQAIPIASVPWTVTHEEVFRELRQYCLRRSQGHTACCGAFGKVKLGVKKERVSIKAIEHEVQEEENSTGPQIHTPAA